MTWTQRIDRVDLIDGPSDGELADGYKYAFRKPPLAVTFTTTEGSVLRVRISALTHQDSSGHEHIFDAFLMGEMTGKLRSNEHRGWGLKGFFNTAGRRNGFALLSPHYISDAKVMSELTGMRT